MNILIVSAIQEKKSFGGQACAKTLKKLEDCGHTVKCIDLYESAFIATTQKSDFSEYEINSFFSLKDEQERHFKRDCLPAHVKNAQDDVRKADLIIFTCPVYWSSPPSVLRNWIEQVFTPGFAYDEKKIFDLGPLSGKSAFFFLTHAGRLGAATEYGIPYEADKMMKSLHERPFQYSGINILPPLTVIPPSRRYKEKRKKALANTVKEITEHIRKASETHNIKTGYPLIHINGRPGVGKKTIGMIVAKKLGGRFIDNHTVLNVGSAACGRATEGYYALNYAVRSAVFENLEQELKHRPVVLTNALTQEVAEHRDTYAQVKRLAQKAGVPFISINLAADFNENAKRVQSPDRTEKNKITDPALLKKMYDDFTLISEPDTYEIDTTSLKAHKSAEKILELAKKHAKRRP